LEAQRMDLLHKMVPTASAIGMLVNPNFPDTEIQSTQVQHAMLALGLQLHVQEVSNEGDLETAFANFMKVGIGALFISNDALFLTRREQLVALAARYSLPAMYFFSDFVAVGGLMSYGPKITEGYFKAGVYTGLMLKGARPADLPVQQPTKFELVINLKTAKVLGLDIPPTVLALADEVIE